MTKIAVDDEHRAASVNMLNYARARHILTGKTRGQFPCSICLTGTIRWAQNPDKPKGYLVGQCSTPKCLAWIE